MSSEHLSAPRGRARFGSPGFARPGVADPYEIFISSADECAVARKLCRDMIESAINPSLSSQPGGPMLVPVMWEDALPQRIEGGETVNDFFVRVARECHATIVLLESTLGDGTRDEVLALLERPATEQKPLAVVAFEPSEGRSRSAELTAFLQRIGKVKILYASTGPMESQDAVMTLAKVACHFALSAAFTSRVRPFDTDGF